MARSLQTAALSFGLVSIPVRLYTAARSNSVSFHLLHKRDGSRIRYQKVCEAEDKVVERDEIVKGYELRKGHYVELTEDELEALEADANRNVEILEFLPLDAVDPVYFEKTYYLGPDRGGEKPYRLLADAMQRSRRAAIAKLVRRGKEELVMIRPTPDDKLILNVLYYADEVRDFGEIQVPEVKSSEKELDLALRLIEGLTRDRWQPEQYRDTYRERVLALIEQKEAGHRVVTAPADEAAPVVDLMAALKRSLDRAGIGPRRATPPRKRRQRATA